MADPIERAIFVVTNTFQDLRGYVQRQREEDKKNHEEEIQKIYDKFENKMAEMLKKKRKRKVEATVKVMDYKFIIY